MDWNTEAYDKMLTYQVEINRKIEMPLVNNEHLLRANTILDIGCGNGYFVHQIASQYPEKEFVAIDIDSSMVEYAHTHNSCKNITYHNKSYEEFSTETMFDVIIARLIVHIIPECRDFFQWIYSHLSYGGALIIIDADDDNYSVYPELPYFSAMEKRTNDKINNIGMRDTKAIVREELAECGFKEDRFFTYSPNSISVDKSLFYRYMVYVVRIEIGDEMPAEAYEELFEWYVDENSFIQYGLYFGLYLKEELHG